MSREIEVKYPPAPHRHKQSHITDFFSEPFWENITDKPLVFPPEEHGNEAHNPAFLSEIGSHTHDSEDVVSGTLDEDRIPVHGNDKHDPDFIDTDEYRFKGVYSKPLPAEHLFGRTDDDPDQAGFYSWFLWDNSQLDYIRLVGGNLYISATALNNEIYVYHVHPRLCIQGPLCFDPDPPRKAKWRAQINMDTDQVVYMGIGKVHRGALQQNFAGFYIDDDDIYATTSNSSGITNTLIGTITAPYNKKFEVVYKITSVDFYIDDVLVATNTTNLPTGNGNAVVDLFACIWTKEDTVLKYMVIGEWRFIQSD
jgi:hypothetical protein